MTNEEAYAIGKRALAAGFKWMPGCLAVRNNDPDFDGVYVCRDDDGKPMFCYQYAGAAPTPYREVAPDVRDVGVVAHMLEQLRGRAGSCFRLHRDVIRDGWEVMSDTPSYLVSGICGTWAKTQGDAIVIALELTHRGGF